MVMDLIVKTKAGLIGKLNIVDTGSTLIESENKKQHTANLINNGYTVLDHKLCESVINDIISYSERIKCYDSYGSAHVPIDPHKAPIETHVAHYNREDLVKFKPIMDLANDSRILQVVQDFLGAKPTISNINMWWSFGGKKQAEHAQLFHRDMDDWRFCKLFIYLTDVSQKSGPHIYVKSSSASPKLRKIRRYVDSEVQSAFGKENIITFTAPKGTAFIVDTYGFHKGLLPESENRLLLQVQYSLYPIGIEKYEPLSSDISRYDKYINRLLIK